MYIIVFIYLDFIQKIYLDFILAENIWHRKFYFLLYLSFISFIETGDKN